MTQAEEDGAALAGTQGPIPTERIRQRAYELWERNHCPPGLELRFWLLAEQQLRVEAEPAATDGGAVVVPPTDPIRPSAVLPPQKPVYRALLLDAAKNVLRTEILFAQTDAEAMALAGALAWQSDIELWDGLRFIEQIPAAGGQD